MKSSESTAINQEYQRIMKHRIAYWNQKYGFKPLVTNIDVPDLAGTTSPSLLTTRHKKGLFSFLLNHF